MPVPPRLRVREIVGLLIVIILATIIGTGIGPGVMEYHTDTYFSYKTVKTVWGFGNPPSYRLGQADDKGLLYDVQNFGDHGKADSVTMTVVDADGKPNIMPNKMGWKGWLDGQDYHGKKVVLHVDGPDGYTEVVWNPGGGQ